MQFRFDFYHAYSLSSHFFYKCAQHEHSNHFLTIFFSSTKHYRSSGILDLRSKLLAILANPKVDTDVLENHLEVLKSSVVKARKRWLVFEETGNPDELSIQVRS